MQWVTLTFILALGMLMASDSVYKKRELDAMRQQLDELKLQDLDDRELAKTIRNNDYAYRVRYFQTFDRRAHGFLLLGVAFFLLCGMTCLERWLFAPALKIPEPTTTSPELERKQILIFSIVGLLILCAILVILRWPPGGDQSAECRVQSADSNNHSELHSLNSELKEDILLADALEEATHHWPQFRGSLLPNKNTLPASWDLTEKWHVEIPLEGFNSPVVWGDNIFLGGGNKTERAVFCYDAKTGEQRWQTVCNFAKEIPDNVDDSTGFSAPTLCVDNKRVYAIFATGELICCTHDGQEVWRKQLPPPDIPYGYASSLLLLGDKLIVQYDLHEAQTLYAISVFTGETVWEKSREAGCSWASPTALFADGKAVIFAATNKSAHGFDAETGEILWTHKGMGGEVATTAFADATKNVFWFANTGAFTGAFSAADGTILCQNGNVPSPDVASAVLFGDKYLMFLSDGGVIAIDTQNAKELYEENFDHGFYASPVVVQSAGTPAKQHKIVAVDLKGTVYLMDASSDTLVTEGKYDIGKDVVATPAFYQGNIIIRTDDNELICLE